MLSDECHFDSVSLPPPPSYPGTPSSFVSMSLPGGGIVSVPIASSGASSPAPSCSTFSPGPPDVLNLSAPGDQVTHFNLDQLLGIVQSFQLDTSQATQEQGPQQNVSTIKKVQLNSMLIKDKRRTSWLLWFPPMY